MNYKMKAITPFKLCYYDNIIHGFRHCDIPKHYYVNGVAPSLLDYCKLHNIPSRLTYIKWQWDHIIHWYKWNLDVFNSFLEERFKTPMKQYLPYLPLCSIRTTLLTLPAIIIALIIYNRIKNNESHI